MANPKVMPTNTAYAIVCRELVSNCRLLAITQGLLPRMGLSMEHQSLLFAIGTIPAWTIH